MGISRVGGTRARQSLTALANSARKTGRCVLGRPLRADWSILIRAGVVAQVCTGPARAPHCCRRHCFGIGNTPPHQHHHHSPPVRVIWRDPGSSSEGGGAPSQLRQIPITGGQRKGNFLCLATTKKKFLFQTFQRGHNQPVIPTRSCWSSPCQSHCLHLPEGCCELNHTCSVAVLRKNISGNRKCNQLVITVVASPKSCCPVLSVRWRVESCSFLNSRFPGSLKATSSSLEVKSIVRPIFTVHNILSITRRVIIVINKLTYMKKMKTLLLLVKNLFT